ncbi:serine/threonine/tyrosine-protein kinase HT1-like [Andrographis paniculata]|uniref:serine/threonine/tyrosine-protein kinase HT1-like n=1 Tax=Andrographis paniculata TaxID=175694 RepID=UPI0021E8C86D|nr:serine/threonine/tyrosine-protein kinase HT1-like [Andrographis paniculata]XP_051135785.1 serine/threonine/tyrosine-protein kinase HT1-like [Andrographis paniculata]XP_051135787.1 serine/threonine/tyrosine-protein kinase HT1-like [Andrographis paniculata]XP_051135788.1 serine/threonine/tyrosine-protein kinase HT1-like [Andrographis paniculata]
MDEESSSWIRRTKFSHTICHRIDPTRLSSVPITSLPNRKSSSATFRSSKSLKPGQPNVIQVQNNPSTNKSRAVSPHLEVKLSETFKEARSNQRRFSTPNPQRKGREKGHVGKLLQRESHEGKSPKSRGTKSPESISPLRHFPSMKFHDKFKSTKESSWTKYFDHGGGRVTSVETADENTIDLSKLFLGLRFAHGAHSQLYHGIYNDEPVAVKIIRVPDDDENGDLGVRLEKQFHREVTLLSRLHHENVIKFVGACRKPLVFCIITEYLPEGSLRAFLHRLEHEHLAWDRLLSMALDVARGMEYIHTQKVIHRDLKPENILITKDFHLKVADFGIACEEAYCDLLADDPGTYRWMAPEMIKRKHYGRKVDVYGFGLILWEFVSGSIPYEDMTPIQAAFAVVNKNLRPAVPQDCPPAMKALIEQCWSLQPDKRPEFWQIVKVLEEFEASYARDRTLKLMSNLSFHDQKKGLLHWIQKHSPSHSPSLSPSHPSQPAPMPMPMLKPKFA